MNPIIQFIHSFQSEWLKTRRSLSSWLVIIGSIFIPLILFSARTLYPHKLAGDAQDPQFWERIFSNCWQLMAIFFLPMGIVLATSLIAQLEFRNNSWKQVHTTPQALTTIFIAKFVVILTMLFQLFVLFNIFTYFAGIMPHIVRGAAMPQQPFPFWYFLEKSYCMFLTALPIVALQFLISLQFKNFLVPLSVGLGLQVASLIAVSWKYGYRVPYTYCPLGYFKMTGQHTSIPEGVDMYVWAVGYFVFFMLLSYVLYIFKREKG